MFRLSFQSELLARYDAIVLSIDENRSYIYTFDSLGSRHAMPANKLSKYLQYEAADKKSYPIEDTCMPLYKRAKVSLPSL